MTEYDKKRFDEIFHSDKYFKNVSDVDMLRTAAECYKLYDYINAENPIEEPIKDREIAKYMHFAYWLGVINERNRRRGR